MIGRYAICILHIQTINYHAESKMVVCPVYCVYAKWHYSDVVKSGLDMLVV